MMDPAPLQAHPLAVEFGDTVSRLIQTSMEGDSKFAWHDFEMASSNFGNHNISDMIVDVHAFLRIYQQAIRRHLGIMCFQIWEKWVPLSMQPWQSEQFELPIDHCILINRDRMWEQSKDLSPEEALSGFKAGLVSSLSRRLWYFRTEAKPPGWKIRFTVHSQNSGDRVHCSPAYFVRADLPFGMPSTPVTSFLDPGDWIFGVCSPARPKVVFDNTHWCVPGRDAQLIV